MVGGRKRRSVGWLAGCVFGVLGFALPSAADESVVNSKHDLSARGPGPIRAVSEQEICIFCHTPHNASPQTPLWNRSDPRLHYRIYESSTTDARIDQPSGPSKMCLSCHDGTMALGEVLSRPASEPIVMTARTIPPGATDLTGDLSDDHPIGFRYDRSLSNRDRQIRPPEVLGSRLPLGAHGEMHCTTCHDPHNNELGDFLRVTDARAAICVSCHEMTGWRNGSHAHSPKRTTGRVVDPRVRLKYATVSENGCLVCHQIHGAAQGARLLRFRREEDNCLNCHSGAVAYYNIAQEIGKSSGHDPRFRQGVHDPTEEPFTMRRHSECVDCHNPHAALHQSIGPVQGTFGPTIKGPSVGASGVTISGRAVSAARFGYEVCFKCHADGLQRPRLRVRRLVGQTNTRLEFQPSNPSFHPVAGPRRNMDVVSLLAPLRVGSMISCVDCHNSDNSRFMGGTGANGPHGSVFAPLLVRNYQTADFTVESAAAYALCYGCHDRTSILGDASFTQHRLHIVNVRAPCSVCHDAHGVYRGQGSAANHGSLINFDLSVVSQATTAGGPRLTYVDTGRMSGQCTLACHGANHVGSTYP